MEHLAGLTLIRKNKEEVSADEVLCDKEFVAFYFCEYTRNTKEFRDFDQHLANCYEEIKEKELSLEIIFVPSHREEDEFLQDLNACSGNWLTVPFGSPVIKKLKREFGSGCIPHIAVVKRDGTVVSTGGCCCIKEKQTMALEEWCHQGDGRFCNQESYESDEVRTGGVEAQPSEESGEGLDIFMEHFAGQTLVKKNKEEVSACEALKDKEFIVFYFSSHWCKPCKYFTPILAKCYEEAKEKAFPLEIIFVSSDRTEEIFYNYMNKSHGDWLAIPFGSPLIDQIKDIFGIEYIPAFKIVKKDGTYLPSGHYSDVDEKGFSAFEEWCK